MPIKYSKTKIEKKSKNTFVITINFKGPNKKFWVNFPWSLFKIIKKEDIGNERQFTIEASSIQTLPQFLAHKKGTMDYNETLQMFIDIGNQIRSLERFDMGIISLDIEDIIVVDNKHFLFIEEKKIEKIHNGKFKVTKLIKKNKFSSPEFQKMDSIPSQISFKSSYYSLAALVIFGLTKKYLISDTWKENKSILDAISQSKLYWSLERSLANNPQNRYYLVI
jgi:hypothetical protein